MSKTVGKVAWGSPETKPNTGNDNEMKKIPFTQMKGNDKAFKGRVVSDDPIMYACHFTTNKTGATVKVNCTGGTDCPVFVEKQKTTCGGNYADSRFYLKWLHNGSIEVLDVGKQIINGIGELMNNPDWGHCNGYDITINKGAKGAMPLYTVAPSPHKELTAEQQVLVTNSGDSTHEDFIDLDARIQPLTAEVVGKILGLETTTKKASVTPIKKSTAEDEEFDDIKWDDED